MLVVELRDAATLSCNSGVRVDVPPYDLVSEQKPLTKVTEGR